MKEQKEQTGFVSSQVKMVTDGEESTFQPITEKDESGLCDSEGMLIS